MGTTHNGQPADKHAAIDPIAGPVDPTALARLAQALLPALEKDLGGTASGTTLRTPRGATVLLAPLREQDSDETLLHREPDVHDRRHLGEARRRTTAQS